MGPIGSLETSVSNYQSTMRNIPEEREYNLQGGGSLKLRTTLNPNSAKVENTVSS